MQNNDISKLNGIHDLDELRAIREAHRKEAEAIKQAEARILQEERGKRHQQEQKFRSDLASEISAKHDLSYGSCVMIVDRAWEDHHSYSEQEVIGAANELADFVEQIIKDEYQNKYWR